MSLHKEKQHSQPRANDRYCHVHHPRHVTRGMDALAEHGFDCEIHTTPSTTMVPRWHSHPGYRGHHRWVPVPGPEAHRLATRGRIMVWGESETLATPWHGVHHRAFGESARKGSMHKHEERRREGAPLA